MWSTALAQMVNNSQRFNKCQRMVSSRDFNLSANDQFLFAVNQNSDNGTLYHRDAQTGLLTLVKRIRDPRKCLCVIQITKRLANWPIFLLFLTTI